jgi:hypothetical protein
MPPKRLKISFSAAAGIDENTSKKSPPKGVVEVLAFRLRYP